MKIKKFILMITFVISSIVNAEEKEIEVLFTTKTLTPEAALKVAKGAMDNCRRSGFQISVAVVDNGGNLQVLLRDKLAGISSPDAAILKARTSINFRSSSEDLSKAVNSNNEASGIKQLPGILVLGGGVIIQAAGSMVGAIGAAGTTTIRDPCLPIHISKQGSSASTYHQGEVIRVEQLTVQPFGIL